MKTALDFEKPIADLDEQIQQLHQHMHSDGLARWCEEHGKDLETEVAQLRKGLDQLKLDRERLMVSIFSNLTPWEKTQVARHKDRPHTLDLVRLCFEDFVELHGDRLFADDGAVVGGMARLDGQRVMVIGHEKGRDLKEKVRRNYGSSRPEGYRKAIRLMKLAERVGHPVITFVDTSAADSSIGAEERGISAAIAWAMEEMAMLRVPTVVVVLGEGGSGGAIGIGVGNRILMLEHAVYSVIPPEGCANILWHDAARAGEAAEALKLTAEDALRLGVIDEVLPEPLGGAHRDAELTAQTIKDALLRHLQDLTGATPEAILAERYDKFRAMGRYSEPAPVADETEPEIAAGA
jgi:acetyl-CoA carboxylase carboxyl transferase subunit alpha